MDYDSEDQIEEIKIPAEVKDQAIASFDFSVRLNNVLRRLDIKVLGDLQGMSFQDIEHARNCGRKTVEELRSFLAKIQDTTYIDALNDKFQRQAESDQKDEARRKLIDEIESFSDLNQRYIIKNTDGNIFVPQEVKRISVQCFGLSIRLGNVLEQLGVKSLGDFEIVSVGDIKKAKNCGRKTEDELHNFIIRIQKTAADEELFENQSLTLPIELNLNGLLKFVNDFLSELPERESEILLNRFGGGQDEKILTLEEIGENFRVTRERIRQMESKNIKALKNRLTGISEAALEKLVEDCSNAICPLTERFLISLTGNDYSLFERPPKFYLRILQSLSPQITIFTGSRSNSQTGKNVKRLKESVKNILDKEAEFLSLAEVYNRVLQRNGFGNATIKDFFEVVQTGDFIIEEGDSADVLLIATDKNRLTMAEIARQVLARSEVPLKPEEIIERAGEMFGSDIEVPSINSLVQLPSYEDDFYLLDSRTIGLRQHFRLPEQRWTEVQNDFYNLLKIENRPVSTTEVLNKKFFEWTGETTPSEATEILREDARFRDLGRFLFALADWEIEERVPVKDLVVRVLEETDDALTATEIGERIQKYRSVSTTTMPTILRGHALIRTFDFGYYGLKSKGDYLDFFITDRKFLNRFIKKNAPLTFAELRRKIGIDEADEESGQKLWAALQVMAKVRLEPNYYLPETIVSYKKW